ncbi:hypothetical protein OS493_036802 [Desmophyllum pertusum]|uniref:Uncharacterized protein n=1 Tax=Desmophyllum pertusum TaxID=174260 RepID=A0A9X0D8A3_9CNID|nr:hypothetical protein OS493_036802 [Desmophyllum pertusum]
MSCSPMRIISIFNYYSTILNNIPLVQQDDDDNRLYYSLHPLVQAFCKSSRDDTCTGYNSAIRLFSQHYLSLLQRLNDDFISTDCKIAIDKYHISKTNICHALLASTEDDLLKSYGLSVSTEAVNFLAKVLNMDEFMSLYSQCLRAADTLTDKTLYSECLVSIGFKQLCYYGYNDAYRTDAKRSLQEAHELQNDLLISDTECLGHCKLAMFTSGKYRAAVNIWQNICLVRYRELLGTHPFTASLLHYIGDAYQKLDDPRRAVAFKKESLAMRKFLLGDDHLDTARAYYGVGCALGALGSTEDALENLNRAREVQVRFIASKQDINKTEQEINRLRGREKNEGRVAMSDVTNNCTFQTQVRCNWTQCCYS